MILSGGRVSKQSAVHFLDGGGEMAKAILAHDWSSNPLGSPDTWPPALKTAVSMTLNSKFPKCLVWGSGMVTIHNDAFRPILGDKFPVLGRSFQDIWEEVWTEIGPIAERAYRGEATFIEDFPLLINRKGYPEQTYFTFCYSPIRDETGAVRGMIDTVIETTQTVEWRQEARLLNGELEHRIKNILSIVSAIAHQTLRSSDTDRALRQAFTQRIETLSQAQAILSRTHISKDNVREIIQESLAPFRTGLGRFDIAGPSAFISSKQGLTLALAINELATNALKYGALSNDTGQILITWKAGRPDSQDEFSLCWREVGGPPVVASNPKGFGSRVIEKVLAQDFEGEVRTQFLETGFVCELTTQMLHLGIPDPVVEHTGGTSTRPQV